MIWSIVVAAVVSAPFVVALVVQPVTRRMAWRYPRRRAVEAVLVILGSMLGTSIITGSLIVGDTIDRSIVSGAYDQLGPIDELVTVPGLAAGDDLVDEAGSLAAVDPSGEVLDGVLPVVTVPVSVVGERVQPRAQLVEVDFAAAQHFGSDPDIVGLPPDGPAPGTVFVTEDLATTTRVDVGDTITVHVYGTPFAAPVARVLDQRGVAGFWPVDGRQQSYNVFVTPGTVATGLSGTRLPDGIEPPQTHLAFSNVGGVESGAELTERATALIAEALDDGETTSVRPVKQNQLDVARSTADSLTQLYLTMGMFSVAAGILLLVNIFVMLADERRSQLGMLRAIGMRRRSLVTGFATEGWLYALVASAVGAVLGIGLGRVIAWRAGQVLGTGDDLYTLELTFAWEVETVVRGFALGLAISVVTIVLTSVRISRLNVIAAIRDLPSTTARRRRRWPVVLGWTALVVGVGWSTLAFAGGEGYGIAAGPMIAATGLGLLVAPRSGVRPATTFAALVVLAWGLVFVPALGWLDVQVGIPIFLVQGFGMCAAGVALLTVHHKALGLWLSRRFGGAIPIRVGLAYPMARTFRTAMTLGMFAIVVLTIVYLAFISAMFGRQVDTISSEVSGGFDVVVTSNPTDPVTVADLEGIDGVTEVAPLAYGIAHVDRGSSDGEWPITGFGPELAGAPPTLHDLGRFESEDAAWQAVLHDPGLVIVDGFLLDTTGTAARRPQPGDEIVLTDPASGSRRDVEVAAVATEDYLNSGVFYGVEGFGEMFGERAVESRFFVAATDPESVADAISTTLSTRGAEAQAVRQLVESLLARTQGFFTLMQQFVGVGLLVGIAGLGVQMVRSVRERRRDVGMLRAIGVVPARVSESFLLEAAFVASEGVVIGVVVALVGSYGLVLNETGFLAGLEWALPWREIVVVGALTILAATVTALVPSRRAGRIRPAEALRVAD